MVYLQGASTVADSTSVAVKLHQKEFYDRIDTSCDKMIVDIPRRVPDRPLDTLSAGMSGKIKTALFS